MGPRTWRRGGGGRCRRWERIECRGRSPVAEAQNLINGPFRVHEHSFCPACSLGQPARSALRPRPGELPWTSGLTPSCPQVRDETLAWRASLDFRADSLLPTGSHSKLTFLHRLNLKFRDEALAWRASLDFRADSLLPTSPRRDLGLESFPGLQG